jgi:N-acetylglucosaminyldiphosphoundecaprenol N-acetyl-beta-D-mannosaminyltransferase
MRNAGSLLGIPIDRKDLRQSVSDAESAIKQRDEQIVFACANPHSIVVAQSDPMFSAALNRATLTVADGVGVTMMAKFAGIEIGPRITGSDYFFAIMDMLAQRGGGRVFFFGSSQKVLDLIAARMAQDYPTINLCGTISPPFGAWSEAQNLQYIQQVNQAVPDVLWVGMTAPKQEKWVHDYAAQLKVPVIGSIGAVFDFFAGTYPRAPQWMIQSGLEWLYRFIKEPKRMWRRAFVSNPRFVWLVLWRHVFGREKSPRPA